MPPNKLECFGLASFLGLSTIAYKKVTFSSSFTEEQNKLVLDPRKFFCTIIVFPGSARSLPIEWALINEGRAKIA